MAERAAPVIYWLAALVVGSAIVLRLAAPDRVSSIDPASIRHESGQAFYIRLHPDPAPRFWALARGDASISPTRSRLTLFEDGRPLGAAHVEHEDIRKRGGGSYSHWTRLLLFSSSDGTSPAAGVHRYTYRAPQTIPVWLQRLALVCALLLLLRALPLLRSALESERTQRLLILLSSSAAAAFVAATAYSFWGAWRLVELEPDSPGYLAPAAAAIFEGRWDHIAARPFVYPGFLYMAIRWGGTLDHVVALQMAAYLLCAPLLYAIVLLPTRRSVTADARPRIGFSVYAPHAMAAGAVAVYFSLSGYYLASAFYVAPELLPSCLALASLWLCLKLTLDRHLRPAAAVAYALAAALSATLLIGMKPAMWALAGLTLALASGGLWRQRLRPRAATLIAAWMVMLALPAAVVVADNRLVQKYQDSTAQLFGHQLAFCNNVDLIRQALETPGSRARQAVGEPAAQAISAFLREIPAKEPSPILGYNGDRCMYELGAQRTEIERRYFGARTEDVAHAYRQLFAASVADAPGLYAKRVLRQLRAYVLERPHLDCFRGSQRRWTDDEVAGIGLPLVQRLVQERSSRLDGQPFPQPLLAEESCGDLVSLIYRPHVPLIIVAMIGSAVCYVRRRSMPAMLLALAQAALIGIAFWLSAAAIVALLHSFDVIRYTTVAFPLYVAMLASTSLFALTLVAYTLRSGTAAGCKRLLERIELPIRLRAYRRPPA